MRDSRVRASRAKARSAQNPADEKTGWSETLSPAEMSRSGATDAAGATGNPSIDAGTDRSISRRSLLFVLGAILVIALLIVAPLLYQRWHADRRSDADRYNGFDFIPVREGNATLWVTRIQVGSQPYDIPFYYHPRETESVVLEPGLTARFLDPRLRPKQVYLSLDPESRSVVVIAGVEVARILGYRYQLLNIDTRGAFFAPPVSEGAETEHVVMTCDDATAERVVILFDEGPYEMIFTDNENPSCIHLQYREENGSIRVADRFAYGLLRIMPG